MGQPLKIKISKSSPTEISIEKRPQCGGDLIEREGKFGKLYGCSNYPNCRFNKK